MKRSASAIWNGSVKEGTGTLSTQSTVLQNTQYSFASRFAEGIGTNPEELVAAAHAGCFSMKLSAVIGEQGFTPATISTKAVVNLDVQQGAITEILLTVFASVPGMSAEAFQAAAESAKTNCPISKLFNTTITLRTDFQE
jgi:osmotically inducible protein OsmC